MNISTPKEDPLLQYQKPEEVAKTENWEEKNARSRLEVNV